MILYKGTSMYLNLALVYAYVVDCHGFKAPTNSEQIFRHAELVVTSTYLDKSLGLLPPPTWTNLWACYLHLPGQIFGLVTSTYLNKSLGLSPPPT